MSLVAITLTVGPSFSSSGRGSGPWKSSLDDLTVSVVGEEEVRVDDWTRL